MKIKHKLTGKEEEITYHEWEDKYLPRKMEESYDIITQDVVMVRVVDKNGTRKNFKRFERQQALKMIESQPLQYDFIDIPSGKIVGGKVVENENPVFRLIDKKPRVSKGIQQVIIGLLVAGFGGLLTYYLVKLVS
jgi:hypothetical protein